MNQSGFVALIIVLLSNMVVSGTDLCDNAPCEPQIDVSLGKEFAIPLESSPSTGFEWWTKFDPIYLGLMNSTFASGNEGSGLAGAPGKVMFTFSARNAGNTDVVMLLLRPWENGTISERRIYPIRIMPSVAEPKQPIILSTDTNPYESLGGLATRAARGASSSYFKNESVMETPSKAFPQYPEPSRYDLSSLSQKSI